LKKRILLSIVHNEETQENSTKLNTNEYFAFVSLDPERECRTGDALTYDRIHEIRWKQKV